MGDKHPDEILKSASSANAAAAARSDPPSMSSATNVFAVRQEDSSKRRFRERNTVVYRLSHWPIWIAVFFLAPGPLIFDLFNAGFDRRMAAWLGLVLLGTGIAGLFGRLPGVEPKPYIFRFHEDKPNPLYRRFCYTFAWGAIVSFAVLNLAGLTVAAMTGSWYLRQIYDVAYFPLVGSVWLLGVLKILPRVRASTRGEGRERRYFYGSLWAVVCAQSVLGVLWKLLPATRTGDLVKLIIFVSILTAVGMLARFGILPRTRVIVPGETVLAD